MENLSLYQITSGFMDLMNKIETEELTEEENKEIETALIQALQTKSINIIGYIQNQEALTNAIDEQIKRLQDFKKQKQNNLDKFKTYVKNNMNILGITKFDTPIGSMSLAKSPISVEIIDEEKIPKEFINEIIKRTPNKTAIKEHFKSTGEIVPGVNINTDNYNLLKLI